MVSGMRVSLLQVDPEISRCIGSDVTLCNTFQVVEGELETRSDTQGKGIRVVETSGIIYLIQLF